MTRLVKRRVEAAMRECDRLGVREFLKSISSKKKTFGYPKNFWVQSKLKPGLGPYPAKAIVAVSLEWFDVNGGYSKVDSACSLLEAIGYEIVGRDGKLLASKGSAETSDINIGETQKNALTKVRRGQQKFRKALVDHWKGACALTGVKDDGLLRASHIIPWTSSSDFDRVNHWNGLLLSALWDAAFDRGLVSFNDDGSILAHKKLTQEAREKLEIEKVGSIKLDKQHHQYIKWHRDNIFGKFEK